MSTHPQSSQFAVGGLMDVDAYLRLMQRTSVRYEYHEGEARMLAGGSVEHDRIARNIANAIEAHFASGPCSVFGSDVQVLVGVKPGGRENFYYPDCTVSCDVADRRRGVKLIRSPRIVVEVLSPGTENFDRGKKLEAYQSCPTIQEIVLINQFAPHLETYQRGEEGWRHAFYDSHTPQFELSSIDVTIALAEVYKNINFDEPLVDE